MKETLEKDGNPFFLKGPFEYQEVVDSHTIVRPKEGFIFQFGNKDNYSQFDSKGHLTMVGDAKTWLDMLTDAVNIKVSGTGVSTNTTESVVEFTTGANLSDYMYLNVQLNHFRANGFVVDPHIHFFASDGADVPNFLLQYRWQKLGVTKVTSWTNYKCNLLALPAPGAGVTNHNIAYGAGITPPSGDGISDIVQFRVLRDNANTSGVFAGADPFSGTVGVLAFDVHVIMDKIGSDTEYL